MIMMPSAVILRLFKLHERVMKQFALDAGKDPAQFFKFLGGPGAGRQAQFLFDDSIEMRLKLPDRGRGLKMLKPSQKFFDLFFNQDFTFGHFFFPELDIRLANRVKVIDVIKINIVQGIDLFLGVTRNGKVYDKKRLMLPERHHLFDILIVNDGMGRGRGRNNDIRVFEILLPGLKRDRKNRVLSRHLLRARHGTAGHPHGPGTDFHEPFQGKLTHLARA